MSADLDTQLARALDGLTRQHRLRRCPELSGASRSTPAVDGRPVTAFCSNDYLDLACHPDVVRAALEAATAHGFGAGASRLVAGDFPPHRQLEHELATFVTQPSALLFPSGYQANIGVVTALAGPGDLIVSDALNHASIIDGCRLSRATVAIYRHADPADAARLLARPGPFARRMLITESVFSMDGDVAPLAELRAVADRLDAVLLVDEAHALGVLGPGGRGACACARVLPDVLVGTLGKSFGAAGGFAAGPPSLRAWLVNRARSFIYSTAHPPAVAAAALAGLRLAAGPEGDRRRARLHAQVALLRELMSAAGLPRPAGPTTSITPVVVGTDAAAMDLAARLFQRGFFVPAIRPPTVPEGTARLRITMSAGHDESDVRALATAILESMS